MTNILNAKTAAIVPAAGMGRRMGSAREKQFLKIFGEPIIVHTLKKLASNPKISTIVLVAPKDKIKFCEIELVKKYDLQKIEKIVEGGEQRQDSVGLGLASLEGGVYDLVLVHDGVRPLISQELIDRIISAALKSQAVVAAVPIKDTIKEIDSNGNVVQTLKREKLWAIQTPQVFSFEILAQAFKKAQEDNFYGTDEASLVEHLGHPVQIMMGEPANIKITTPEDLIVAEAYFKAIY